MISKQQSLKADLSGSDRHCRKKKERRVFRPLPEFKVTSCGSEERAEEYPMIDVRDKLCTLLLRAVEHVKSDRRACAYECANLALSTLEEQIKATALPKVPLNAWKNSLGGY